MPPPKAKPTRRYWAAMHSFKDQLSSTSAVTRPTRSWLANPRVIGGEVLVDLRLHTYHDMISDNSLPSIIENLTGFTLPRSRHDDLIPHIAGRSDRPLDPFDWVNPVNAVDPVDAVNPVDAVYPVDAVNPIDLITPGDIPLHFLI